MSEISGASLIAKLREDEAGACAHLEVRYEPLDVSGRRFDRWRCRSCGRQFMPGTLSDVRLLVLGEKERCAKIADTYRETWGGSEGCQTGCGAHEEIAAKIREVVSLKPKEQPVS